MAPGLRARKQTSYAEASDNEDPIELGSGPEVASGDDSEPVVSRRKQSRRLNRRVASLSGDESAAEKVTEQTPNTRLTRSKRARTTQADMEDDDAIEVSDAEDSDSITECSAEEFDSDDAFETSKKKKGRKSSKKSAPKASKEAPSVSNFFMIQSKEDYLENLQKKYELMATEPEPKPAKGKGKSRRSNRSSRSMKDVSDSEEEEEEEDEEEEFETRPSKSKRKESQKTKQVTVPMDRPVRSLRSRAAISYKDEDDEEELEEVQAAAEEAEAVEEAAKAIEAAERRSMSIDTPDNEAEEEEDDVVVEALDADDEVIVVDSEAEQDNEIPSTRQRRAPAKQSKLKPSKTANGKSKGRGAQPKKPSRSAPTRQSNGRNGKKSYKEKHSDEDIGMSDVSDSPRRSSDAEEEEEDDSGLHIDKLLWRRVVTEQTLMRLKKRLNEQEEAATGTGTPTDGTQGDLPKVGDVQYLVKWKNMSYRHVSWHTKEELAEIQTQKGFWQKKLDKFELWFTATHPSNKEGSFEDVEEEEDAFRADFCEVDRIIGEREDPDGSKAYLVKWCSLPYSESTWERADSIKDDAKIESFYAFSKLPPVSTLRYNPPRPKLDSYTKIEESPVYKNDNKLLPYQLEGINWLIFNWYNGRNSILADEMGLGKTVQSVCFLDHLKSTQGHRGPFLIVAPLSTLPHWKREFEGWTDMNAVVYHGSQEDREYIHEWEFYYEDKQGQFIHKSTPKFHALITTYEMLMNCRSMLQKFVWRTVIVDEAHRLKNKQCKLGEDLRNLEYKSIVLLTGTPIQNNTYELWTLLNVVDSHRFADLSDFSSKFGSLTDSSQVDSLHELLKPYMLRRMKSDVMKKIPPKEETIVEVEMTALQKKYYRAIYERNFAFLCKNKKPTNLQGLGTGAIGAGSGPSLLNIMMELRKCCNHPYLVKGAEAANTTDINQHEENMNNLLNCSGKLILVDKLLKKLKSDEAAGKKPSKVLIFSQMTRVLDILEDFLVWRGYAFERIDGTIQGNARQAAIDRFSKPGSDRFVFLLCTRAGGLGINLTAANTVVIFDSDWNPQNDLQAQARCHRIGQTDMVKVYRLITRKTYEMEMFHKASLKLGLDQAVLHKMTASTEKSKVTHLATKEIDSLLKRGAYDVFREEDDTESQKFCEADIDQILETSARTVKYGETVSDDSVRSTFSKASFVTSNACEVDVNDPDFWKKIAGADATAMANEENEVLDRQDRRKKYKAAYIDDGIEDRGNKKRKRDVEMEDFEPDFSSAEREASRKNKKHSGAKGSEDDSGSDEDGHGKKRIRMKANDWKKSERDRLRPALMNFGWGQWKQLHEALKCTKTEVEVELFSLGLIRIMEWIAIQSTSDEPISLDQEAVIKLSVDNSKALAKLIDEFPFLKQIESRIKELSPVPLNVEDESKADSANIPATPASQFTIAPILLEPTYIEASRKLAITFLEHLDLLSGIHELGSLVESTPEENREKLLPRISRGTHKMNYWGDKEDEAILLWIHRNGIKNLAKAKDDPKCDFAATLKMLEQMEAVNAWVDSEKALNEDRYNPHKPVQDYMKKKNFWPQNNWITARMRQIVDLHRNKHNKQHKHSSTPSHARKSHQVLADTTMDPIESVDELIHNQQFRRTKVSTPDRPEWTSSDKKALLNAIMDHGMPLPSYFTDTKQSETSRLEQWNQLVRSAQLESKPLRQVRYFCDGLLRKCCEAVELPVPETQPKSNAKHELLYQVMYDMVPSNSRSGAKRMLNRIKILDQIRNVVLSNPISVDLAQQFTDKHDLSEPTFLWWKPTVHNFPLLQGVVKHGMHGAYDILKDPSFPFMSSIRAYAETPKAELALERSNGYTDFESMCVTEFITEDKKTLPRLAKSISTFIWNQIQKLDRRQSLLETRDIIPVPSTKPAAAVAVTIPTANTKSPSSASGAAADSQPSSGSSKSNQNRTGSDAAKSKSILSMLKPKDTTKGNTPSPLQTATLVSKTVAAAGDSENHPPSTASPKPKAKSTPKPLVKRISADQNRFNGSVTGATIVEPGKASVYIDITEEANDEHDVMHVDGKAAGEPLKGKKRVASEAVSTAPSEINKKSKHNSNHATGPLSQFLQKRSTQNTITSFFKAPKSVAPASPTNNS